MLQPSNRHTLVAALRPPDGYDFESAMAVTFTLDLRALLAAPAAFALGAAGRAGSSDGGDPIDLLHAVKRHAGNITVLCEPGGISVPPARKVFTFLEDSVVPVTAPRHGLVHPKVWVVRYRSPDSDATCLRVLSSSRNLTFDTSWDTILRLDQAAEGADLSAVGSLFEQLVTHPTQRVGPEHLDRIASLANDLRTARFAVPEPADDLRVHVLGLDEPESPLPLTADRSLIVSPFVSDDFFTKLQPGGVETLVSRHESIGELKPETLKSIENTYGFDDGSSSESNADDSGLDERSPGDPARPLRGLHAKIFAYEHGDTARLFLGSANATGAAFGSNVEILFELTGSTESLGIDALTQEKGEELGLDSLLVPVREPEEQPSPPETGLDSERERLGRLSVHGTVTADDDGLTVRYQTDEPIKLRDGFRLTCWPLPTPASTRELTEAPLDASFPTSLENISRFLVFRLEHLGSETETDFVVPAQMTGIPEGRTSKVLQLLIGGADRFLRYLLATLNDDSHELSITDIVDRTDPDGTGKDRASAALTIPVLEAMMRSMRRRPERIVALAPLVADLEDDDALPAGFAEVWEALEGVTRELEDEK